MTISSTNSFTGGATINGGTVRASAPSALGSGLLTVNNGTTLILGGAHSNSITLSGATLAAADGNRTLSTNSELVITAGTTNILQSGDPQQNTTTSRDLAVDARLRGSGLILVKNADGILSTDGNQGVRFRNANAISDFSGTVIYTNNTKGEILVTSSGPFSPIGTGRIVMYAGSYDGDTTQNGPAGTGYSEFNSRNNSAGDSVVSNDMEIAGSGAVVINALGSAANGSVMTLGNLKIGDMQELIGYKAAATTTNGVKFSSVTLTGGNATFTPHSSTFGPPAQAGSFFVLNDVGQSTPGAGIIMNGLDTLTLTGTSTYSGPTAVHFGKLLLNGSVTGGGTLTADSGTFVGGNGTNNGPVDISGTLLPGDAGIIGTFGSGPLTLEGGAALAFDLSGTNTANGGVNDLIRVTGNLTLNGNVISNNVKQSTMQTGSYRLVSYTGTLNSFSPMSAFLSLNGVETRYTATVDTGTSGQVNLVVGGGPATLVWNSTASTAWDAGSAGTPNWSNAVSHVASDVFYSGDNVVLNDSVAGVQSNLTLTAIAVAPGALTNNSATSYTISGDGKISGAATVVKSGSSTLTLATSNDFTGAVAIRGGTVKVSNAGGGASSLGAIPGASVTITNGGTLDLGGNPTVNGINFGQKQFFISGGGASGDGAIINSVNTNQINAFQLITLTGNATFGGIGRWDMRGGSPGPALDLAGFKLTKTGSNQISLVAVSATAGDIDINLGVLSFETGSTVTNGGTITVNPAGSLGHYRQSAGLFTRPIVLNGGAITNLSGGGATNDSPITVAADSILTCNTGNDLYLRGPISGAFGLTKINSGTVIFAGTNTYAGATIVSNGTLTLVDSASPLTNSAMIRIASGANLDVTQRSNSVPAKTLALVGNQTLQDDGTVLGDVRVGSGATLSGTGSIASNLTVSAGGILSPGGTGGIGKLSASISAALSGHTIMEINKANLVVTNDQLASGGPIIFGGTLSVTNIGPALQPGDTFQLFAGSGTPVGIFAAIELGDPGAGVAWNTDNLNVNGTLSVVSAAIGPTTNASITKVTLSGTNLIVHGTNNNVPNTSFHYVVLTTTNIATPLSNWIPVVTNPFNADGTFDYTSPIVSGTPRQFIDVKAVP